MVRGPWSKVGGLRPEAGGSDPKGCRSEIEGPEVRSVEPLFDFDDTKTLVLLFLIKLLSVSRMNLTFKANPSLITLKNLSYSVKIRIQMERIRIHMSKMQIEMKWDEWIRITLWWIRISKGKFQTEAVDRNKICTPTKKGIFVHIPDIFGLAYFRQK